MNPLSIAVAAVLLAAGGAFGWSVKGAAPTAKAATGGELALEPVDAPAACAADDALLRETVLQGDGGASPRLADDLPRKSPIPGFERVRFGALDPAGDPDYLSGAVEGDVSTFRPPGDGGFEVYAYRFLTRPAAVEAVVSAIAERACGPAAKVFLARGRAGTVVVREGDAASLSAWWLTRDEVVFVVSYRGWGDAGADMANLSAVVRATASG